MRRQFEEKTCAKKKTAKKLITAAAAVICMAAMVTGYGSGTESTSGKAGQASAGASAINVISREDGSGTRGAFIELFGIEQKDENGEKVDYTTEEAQITNNTSVMMTTVGGDTSAIGYISLGSLNDTVKAVKIDGAEASVQNVLDGNYKVTRPFNIVINEEELSEAAQDFMNYILSSEGQAVVEENGYIPLQDTEGYTSSGTSGKVVVAGSSSVTPVMEKIAESYQSVNADVTVEIQQSDSTTGVTSVQDGLCDIGMASRELKEEEAQSGVTAVVMATDGIAVIVNNENPVDELTSEQVKGIFTGEITSWSDVQ